MKTTLFILTILVISCKSDIKKEPAIPVQTEIDQDAEYLKLKAETVAYYKKLMAILNLKYLDSEYLAADEKIIRFQKSDAWQEDVTIIDIYKKPKNQYTIQKTNYSFDNDCNPVVGSKPLSEACIKVNSKSEKSLSNKDYEKLLKQMDEEEIWDLKEDASDVYQLHGLLYHGEFWDLEIRYCLKYYSPKDTTICTTQKIRRIFPEQFHGIYTIGNQIMNLIE